MKYKKENKKSQTDITYFYIDPKEKILLEKPDLKKEYVEAFLKPDKQPVSAYCENTTTFD